MIVNRFGWAVGLSCVSSGVRVKPSITPRASVAPSRPPGVTAPALMLPGQPRCSIVAVTAAGRPAVPGCGAGARDSRGMRESGGGGRPEAQA